jgi:hypothetical protein
MAYKIGDPVPNSYLQLFCVDEPSELPGKDEGFILPSKKQQPKKTDPKPLFIELTKRTGLLAVNGKEEKPSAISKALLYKKLKERTAFSDKVYFEMKTNETR